jgi:hypothetical protein
MEMIQMVWGLWQSFMAAVVAVACGWFAWELLFKNNRK